jgi:molybdate transport system permease protein
VSLFDALSPAELEALELSLRVASWNLAVGLPLAVAVAWILARCRFVGKELLNGLVHLPLILPPVVTGYMLLLLFGRRGPLGELLEQAFGIVVASGRIASSRPPRSSMTRSSLPPTSSPDLAR